MSDSGISWAICKSASRSRQITTPAPHYSVFYRPDAGDLDIFCGKQSTVQLAITSHGKGLVDNSRVLTLLVGDWKGRVDNKAEIRSNYYAIVHFTEQPIAKASSLTDGLS